MANGDIQSKVAQFMRGRNGVDELGMLTVEVALILGIVNAFARQLWLGVVVVALLAYAVFRVVSTNVGQRRKESYGAVSYTHLTLPTNSRV